MGELVPASVFQKWQAVINNSKCVLRVTEIRQNFRAGWPYVDQEGRELAAASLNEAQQIDLLTNYLLDINHAEPLDSDSVVKQVEGPMPQEPA